MPPAPHLLIVGMGPRVGHHAARRFGSAGYRVGMIARSVVHLAAHQRDLAAVGVEAHYANADVADADGLRDAVEKMTVALGTPQVVLFTPADRVAGRAITVDPAAVRRALDVGAMGALTAMQALLPAMTTRGTGSMLFMGSSRALDPRPHGAAEAAAQAALRALVLAAARDHERDGVHVALLTLTGEPRPATPTAPARIADALWDLAQEPSGAWTQERTFGGQQP